MAVDNRTENRNYPLPDPTNLMNEDVVRLAAALEAIDADIAAVAQAVVEKADADHQHEIADVTGLQDALNSKASIGHAHALDDLSDVSTAGATNGQVLKRVGTAWSPATLQIGDVSGLEEAINTPSSHNHDDRYYTDDEVDLLLGGKADVEHNHDSAYVPLSRQVATTGLATGGGDLSANRTIDVPKASGSDMRAGTNDDKALTTKAAYDAMAEVELTDAATIAIDLQSGTDFRVTLNGNRTLGNPINAAQVIGKKGRIRITHSDRTLAFGSNWKFAGGEAPDLSSGSNKTDILYYDVIAADRVLGVLVPEIS